MTSHKSFHSGHLAITVILRGPDGDRYGQVLLYLQNMQDIMSTCLNTQSAVRENIFDLLSALFLFVSVKWSKVPSKEHYGNFDLL